MSNSIDPNLLVTSPIAAVLGALAIKLWDWLKFSRDARRSDLTSASDAHAALNADLRASLKVLTEEVARLRTERDMETARLSIVVKQMQTELHEAREQSAQKDVRIAALEQEIATLHQKVFGAENTPEQ